MVVFVLVLVLVSVFGYKLSVFLKVEWLVLGICIEIYGDI